MVVLGEVVVEQRGFLSMDEVLSVRDEKGLKNVGSLRRGR